MMNAQAGLGTDEGCRANRADGLAFVVPLHVRCSGGGETVVADVDGALAVLVGAGALRYGPEGRERTEWSLALEDAASAKFAPTPAVVEGARRAFRAYAVAVGILVTVRVC